VLPVEVWQLSKNGEYFINLKKFFHSISFNIGQQFITRSSAVARKGWP